MKIQNVRNIINCPSLLNFKQLMNKVIKLSSNKRLWNKNFSLNHLLRRLSNDHKHTTGSSAFAIIIDYVSAFRSEISFLL